MISGRYIPDYYHLRAFEALVEEHRVCHAASRLHTSHANLRRMVGSLESWSGAKLYETDAEGLFQPTDTGRVVLQSLEPLWTACTEFQKALEEIHQKGQLLRIGVCASLFRSQCFGRILALLRKDRRLKPVPVSLSEEAGMGSLESGESDLFLSTSCFESRRTVSGKLGDFPLRILSLNEGEAQVDDWKILFDRGFALSPAISKLCEDDIRKSCGLGPRGQLRRFGLEEFGLWRDQGGDVPFCIAVDGETDPSHFKGKVQSCPGTLTSSVSLTRLRNHPYPFLEGIMGDILRSFDRVDV